MNPRARAALTLSGLLTAALAVAAPVAATGSSRTGLTIPVTCETSAETLLAWDGATYDLRGTCGVVRVTADDVTVTMPTATRLVVEGSGASITARSLYAVEVTGDTTALTTPSVGSLALAGSGSTVTVAGLLEHLETTGAGSSVTADTVHRLRMRGSDSVTATYAYRSRISGSDNALALGGAERLVVTGDRNSVRVAEGVTRVRDRGAANVLDVRRPPRRGR